MHGQVSFICSECSGVFGMKGSIENKGSECKREAVSKPASVLHSRVFEARWRRNGHIDCRVSGWLLAERDRDGRAGQ